MDLGVKRNALLLLASAAFAWRRRLFPPQGPPEPRSSPEIVSRDAPATFSSRVNLVPVTVVVRDRAGHAVGNLRQEDFQLFDKGKAQVISKFSMESHIAAGGQALWSVNPTQPRLPRRKSPLRPTASSPTSLTTFTPSRATCCIPGRLREPGNSTAPSVPARATGVRVPLFSPTSGRTSQTLQATSKSCTAP